MSSSTSSRILVRKCFISRRPFFGSFQATTLNYQQAQRQERNNNRRRSLFVSSSSTWLSSSSVSSSKQQQQRQKYTDQTYLNKNAKETSTTTTTTTPDDYHNRVMDQIVLSDDYTSIDTTEAEMNLQRLANETSQNPNPNLLLNMLEMLHNDDVKVSSSTLTKIFQQVVQSKHINILQKAESLIVWNYGKHDPNLLRLLIIGYVHADATDKAFELLMKWPVTSSSTTTTTTTSSYYYPQVPPKIQSYRIVLTSLSKKGDYQRCYQLLKHLYYHSDIMEERKNNDNNKNIIINDNVALAKT